MKTRQIFNGSPGTLLLLATIGVLALFSFDCIEKFQSPVAPNWDTQLSVPLLDSTYHLSEAMSTNPGIIIVDGGYVYQPDRFQFDPVPMPNDTLSSAQVDIDQDVDVPLGSFSSAFSADSVFTDSIAIRLHITHPGRPVDLNLALAGKDVFGNVVATLPPFVQRIPPNTDAVYEFPRDAMAQFLSGFVSRHGTIISVHGTATINPQNVYSTIPHQMADLQDTSNLSMGLEVIFPLKAGVINGSIVDRVSVNGTSTSGANVDKDLLTSVRQATVYLVADNAIPVAVNFRLDFLNISGDTILTLPKPGQQVVTVPAGTAASPTHTPQPIGIAINTEDAQKFGDAVDVIISVGLNTGGAVARFTPQDYVHVRTYTNMVFNINPDKLKNK